MKKFKTWMQTTLMPQFAKVSTQRHLLAIRNGIVQILPFVIAGSIAMIIIAFPIGSQGGDTLASIMPKRIYNLFYWMYKMNFTTLGLVAAIAIGSELAKSYRLNPTVGATIGAFSLLIWIMPTVTTEVGKAIPISAIDASSMLGAIVGSIIAVEIYRIVVKYNITIKLPKEVPVQVTQAFVAIVPVVFITISFAVVRYIIGFDLRVFINSTLEPVGNFVSGNVGGAILINFLICFTWWFGINMSGMLNAMVRPFWLKGLEHNAAIYDGSKKGEYKVFIEQFNQSFVNGGGGGTTIGMVFAILIFAKSKGNRSVAWIALTPGIFNINEPLIFGYPIMLNPFFLVPFIMVPIVNTLIAGWLVPLFGIHIIAAAPWTLPTPILALLSSGMQWQAVVLAIITIAISFGIYTPFVMIHDKNARKLKLAEEKAEKIQAKEALAKTTA